MKKIQSRLRPSDLTKSLFRALQKLKHGECWCEVSIDNPMYKEHSDACKNALNVTNDYINRTNSEIEELENRETKNSSSGFLE